MTHLKVGDKAPDFSAKDQDGNTISLSDYKGKKLVVFFYPKASTPGCTAEACNLNDNYDRFKALGYEILGGPTQRSVGCCSSLGLPPSRRSRRPTSTGRRTRHPAQARTAHR